MQAWTRPSRILNVLPKGKVHKQVLVPIVSACIPVFIERNFRTAWCKGAVQAPNADLFFCRIPKRVHPGAITIDRIIHSSRRLQIRVLGLDGTKRFIPKLQGDVPWAAMYFERFRFVARFVTAHTSVTDLASGVGYGSEILTQQGATVLE